MSYSAINCLLDQGQALFVAYVLLVVTKGPLENFNYNSQVMASTVVCAHQQLIEGGKEIVKILKRPLEGKNAPNLMATLYSLAKKCTFRFPMLNIKGGSVLARARVDRIAQISCYLPVTSTCLDNC